MFPSVRVGVQTLADGTLTQSRASRDGSGVGCNGHGSYQEAVYRQQVFTLTLAASSGTVAAGNAVGALAAQTTQFALLNPTASGRNLVLLRFRLGIISATTISAGPIFHGYLPSLPLTGGNTTCRTNLLGSGNNSIASCVASAAGIAFTGGPAPVTHMATNFSTTATTPASPFLVSTEDVLDGSIIVPPGMGWLPLFQVVGTAILYACSITWEEVPI